MLAVAHSQPVLIFPKSRMYYSLSRLSMLICVFSFLFSYFIFMEYTSHSCDVRFSSSNSWSLTLTGTNEAPPMFAGQIKLFLKYLLILSSCGYLPLVVISYLSHLSFPIAYRTHCHVLIVHRSRFHVLIALRARFSVLIAHRARFYFLRRHNSRFSRFSFQHIGSPAPSNLIRTFLVFPGFPTLFLLPKVSTS